MHPTAARRGQGYASPANCSLPAKWGDLCTLKCDRGYNFLAMHLCCLALSLLAFFLYLFLELAKLSLARKQPFRFVKRFSQLLLSLSLQLCYCVSLLGRCLLLHKLLSLPLDRRFDL